ncbi:MAG: ubiquitin-conjugating enzyme E2 [Capsulimonadaceae bacterium]
MHAPSPVTIDTTEAPHAAQPVSSNSIEEEPAQTRPGTDSPDPDALTGAEALGTGTRSDLPHGGAANAARSSTNVMIDGWSDVGGLLSVARRIASDMGLPDTISPALANAEGMLMTLLGWGFEQASSFAQRLQERCRELGHVVRATVGRSDFNDYLIGRLYVEGPDQAAFAVENVRASTTVGDLAQGIINQEYSNSPHFSRDAKGKPRNVVADLVDETGAHRLRPDSTLHDAGISEEARVNVHPEGRAGAVSPQIREPALVRAKLEIVEFADTHPGFIVEADGSNAPTEYVLRFQARSFATPSQPGDEPREIEDHVVFVALPPDFPMKAPLVIWQTDIFHPNIDAKYGKVCLGVLDEQYRIGLDFRDLCQFLVDIAGYRNYAADDGYNGDAMRWAISVPGQLAIERIGGESVTRQLARQYVPTEPRRLLIRKLD